MAQKDDKDSGTQSKFTREDPFFIHKRELHKSEQKKLISEVLSINKNIRSQYETWETMSGVFSRKVEISITRLEALAQQAKKKDSTNVSPETTQESEESTVPDINDEKTVAKDYYMMWRKDLEKTIKEQREKTRQWVETWFKYLHGIDAEEEKSKPSWRITIHYEAICYWLVILFGVLWIISPTQSGVTAKYEKGLVPSLFERVLEFPVGVYNLYLTMHNIVTEDTGNA